MNNREREGLYVWWKQSKQSKDDFIKENKGEIDRVIFNVLNNHKPAHYLRYGG